MDPFGDNTPSGGSGPWLPVSGPAVLARGPSAVPELPDDEARPLAVPELPADQWPAWLVPPDQRSERRRARIRWILEWLSVLVVALLLAVGVRAYVAQMFYIPSGSMLPTLTVGERIVVDKVSYHLHTVQRGDIVVFSRPPLEQADYSDLVKRVIGLPGDTIASVNGRVTVNGRPLAEPWLPTPPPETLPSPLTAPYSLNHPYKVPPGEYYVMGDNRTDSEDSRYFGPIPRGLIVGKMAFKVWPFAPDIWLIGAVAVIVIALVVLLVSFRAQGGSRGAARRAHPRGPPAGTGAGPA